MEKYARRIAAMAESAAVVKGIFGALGDPELISLGIGAPAKEALPVDTLRQISNDILRTALERLLWHHAVGRLVQLGQRFGDIFLHNHRLGQCHRKKRRQSTQPHSGNGKAENHQAPQQITAARSELFCGDAREDQHQ